MKKPALFGHSFAAIALFAVLAFAPAAAFAGSCICSNNPSAPPVEADTAEACNTMCGGSNGTFTGSSSSAGGSSASKSTGLDNPLAGVCGGKTGQGCVQIIIGNVIRAALGISGSIALLMMTWGGFLWLTSMGNSERVDKGKSTLIWSTLGLVLIFGAYAVTSYIIKAIATGGK